MKEGTVPVPYNAHAPGDGDVHLFDLSPVGANAARLKPHERVANN
jgi:hypothetical protein